MLARKFFCNITVCSFFEWYRDKGQRQPYFIHFTNHAPSEEMMELVEGVRVKEEEREDVRVKEEKREGVKEEGVMQDSKWEHPTGRMLTMAGLFDIWRSPKSVSVASQIPNYKTIFKKIDDCPLLIICIFLDQNTELICLCSLSPPERSSALHLHHHHSRSWSLLLLHPSPNASCTGRPGGSGGMA